MGTVCHNSKRTYLINNTQRSRPSSFNDLNLPVTHSNGVPSDLLSQPAYARSWLLQWAGKTVKASTKGP